MLPVCFPYAPRIFPVCSPYVFGGSSACPQLVIRVWKIGILVVAKGGKSCGGSGGLAPGKIFWVLSWQNTNLEVDCIIYQCKFSQEQPLGCVVRQIYESSFCDVNPWASIRGNLAEHTSNCKASVPLSATFQRKEVLAVCQRMQCTKQYAFLRSYRSSAVWPFPDIASAC